MAHRTLAAALVLVALGSAHAQTRTYVKLAGKDDSLPKLGLPGITVEVFGPRVEESARVRAELARELSETVHTRAVPPAEPGDYALAVTLATSVAEPRDGTLPFEAVMIAADGRKLWRVEGHSEVEAGGPGGDALASIARNVVSAMIHDGWVAQRYDPDDPPPVAPTIRRVDSTPRD